MVRIAMTLKIRPELVEEYKQLHRSVWPAVERMLKELGFRNLTIFHRADTLFLYQEYHGTEPIEKAYERYSADSECQRWERMMGIFQQETPGALPGVRWATMEEVYHLPG